MALTKSHKANFKTILRAFANSQVALMECTNKGTGEKVAVICAVSHVREEFAFVPLAQLFNGNPCDVLESPQQGGAE